MQTGNDIGTWGSLLNNDFISIVDNNLGSAISINVAGGVNVNLTSAQAENFSYTFTGALTGNITIFWPTGAGFYSITNSTTGAYTLTVAPLGGTGFAVQQGNTASVFISTNTGVAAQTENWFSTLSVSTLNVSILGVATLNVGAATGSTYTLNVVQAGTNQAYFGSTGTNDSNVFIDNAAGGNGSKVEFLDAGAPKWWAGKNGSNQFGIYDYIGNKYFLTATTSGDLTLGAAQNFNIDQSGNVGIGTSSTSGYALNIVQNGFSQAYFGATGANQVNITLNAATSQDAKFFFGQNGTTKFSSGFYGFQNAYGIYDTVNNKFFLEANPGGNLILGAAQNFNIDQSGNATTITQANTDSSTKIATTAFANPATSNSVNGYVKLPGGTIKQWLTFTPVGTNTVFNYPITFPNNCYNIQITRLVTGSTSSFPVIAVQNLNTSSGQIYASASISGFQFFIEATGD